MTRPMTLAFLLAAAVGTTTSACGGDGGSASGGASARASSSAAAPAPEMDRAYAVQFFEAMAKAFGDHKDSGEAAAKAALEWVEAHRADHDKLKAAFDAMTTDQYMALTKGGDDVGKAIMAFSLAISNIKDMETSYKTDAWQKFTTKEQPRPGAGSR